MSERPILFNGAMVRAILAGRKTQTRRVVTHFSGETYATDPVRVGKWKMADGKWWAYADVAGSSALPLVGLKCPYGSVGDRLWVRETWAMNEPTSGIICRADGESHNGFPAKWRPSIFMPRWASRLTLEVAGVRVERVQDIGKDGRKAHDVLAEGITEAQIEHWRKWLHIDDAPAHTFGELWNSINSKRGFGWYSNPFVWVIEFKKL